jgi:hypothetical protein
MHVRDGLLLGPLVHRLWANTESTGQRRCAAEHGNGFLFRDGLHDYSTLSALTASRIKRSYR